MSSPELSLTHQQQLTPFQEKDKGETTKQNQVSQVNIFGVMIVSLMMDGKERLCLAQISSTLLKDFSYNEIHNRRVALGITCQQCTPVQLEILRRTLWDDNSSAERLCQSFLGNHAPPQLPENFAFDVFHECAWGCRGAFVPSRYNSSRAKCIRCAFCNLFFSPNKFIFHSHRLPDSRYVQPDAANFNSWRRHLKLCGDDPTEKKQMQQFQFAWEDVKAMFNGGTRKRLLAAHHPKSCSEKRQKQERQEKSAATSKDPPQTSDNNNRGSSSPLGNFLLNSSPVISPAISPTTTQNNSIWNPSISPANNNGGRLISPLPPPPLHPLHFWSLRRPLFPFSHPFGPSLSSMVPNKVLTSPQSAFKPFHSPSAEPSLQQQSLPFFNNCLDLSTSSYSQQHLQIATSSSDLKEEEVDVEWTEEDWKKSSAEEEESEEEEEERVHSTTLLKRRKSHQQLKSAGTNTE